MATFIINISKVGSSDIFDTYTIKAHAEFQAVFDATDRFEREYPNEDSELFDFVCAD